MTVLVVEDEPAMREVLDMRLRSWGYGTLTAPDAEEGARLAQSHDPDIVLSDVVMPGKSGLELLQALKSGNPARPVILITAQGTIDMAVEAMKLGAQDFLTKPLDYSKLQALLQAAREEIDLRWASRKMAAWLEKDSGFGPFVGSSQHMREIYELLETIAASDASAILTGESGTGKELAARAIHERSARAQGPFVAINAAAIPETLIESELFGHEKGAFTGAVAVRPGCFEMAHKGTLFLDEIVEMPPSLQPKLLRVLENGRVRRLGGRQEFAFDVRVLAATNRDPPGRPLLPAECFHGVAAAAAGAEGRCPGPGPALPSGIQCQAQDRGGCSAPGGLPCAPRILLAGKCARAPERHGAGGHPRQGRMD